MFRRVALITFANVLVKNQILLKNKQMICRHFFVTLYFITEDLRPPWVGLRPSGPRKRNNNLADMKYPIGC